MENEMASELNVLARDGGASRGKTGAALTSRRTSSSGRSRR
jgi:hypothetical protein